MFDEPPYGYAHIEGQRKVALVNYEARLRMDLNIRLLKRFPLKRRTILFCFKLRDSLDYRINKDLYRKI